MTSKTPDILCIGAVLWDIIGRADLRMKAGHDVPGRITRLPGGVAMNIAMTLKKQGLTPALLTAIGRDEDGDALVLAADSLGMITSHILRTDAPTDVYMAIEGSNGLIAAIADARGLEKAGNMILMSLQNGILGDEREPWAGCVALDGNLTEDLLSQMATSTLLSKADLRVAPASPGKALRLKPLFRHPTATFYVNLTEANLILGSAHENTERAAEALLASGASRIVVTDGANPASVANADNIITRAPPPVIVKRVTGAGDTFMAAHIAAELRGASGNDALNAALQAAADYISTEDSPC